MADCDILIVGGGIAGAGLGAALSARRNLGPKIALLEAEEAFGYHATGRSAAFWLESYGGPRVAPLTRASHDYLDRHGWLRRRGALHLARQGEQEALDAIAASTTVESVDHDELHRRLPGLALDWAQGLFEPSCADIDVAGLHQHWLGQLRRAGATLETRARVDRAERSGDRWIVALEDGRRWTARVLVNASGAWADAVARRAGVPTLGIVPKRRTMVQLRLVRTGLRDLPLIADAAGSFYVKGEGDRTVWLSPHDEIDSEPCDCAPEEMDVAKAIARFEAAFDWPIEAVERRWAGLRSFAPDRVPVYGFDPAAPGFFWCAGQGGFGIQTAPAASALAAALLLGERPDLPAAPFLVDRFR